MPMLKVKGHDPKRELEFDVECALQYTIAERIHKQLELTKHLLKLAKQYEHRKPFKIIKRKAG